MSNDDSVQVNRRRLLKLLGGTTVALGVGPGVASAHQVQFFGCEAVCTDTQGNFAVVDTGDGYEGRELVPASRDGTDWSHDHTFCYSAAADEMVVGFIEEDQYRGPWADDGCTLCANPAAAADAATILAGLDESTVGACAGALDTGDCATVGVDDASPTLAGWPMIDSDAAATNFNADAGGVRSGPTVAWETTDIDHGIVLDGSVYGRADQGRTVYSLDAADGSVEWSTDITPYNKNFAGTPLRTLAAHGETLYVAGRHDDIPQGGALLALDTTDGTTRWTAEFDGFDNHPTEVIVADGVPYAAVGRRGTGPSAARFDPDTGTVVWQTTELVDPGSGEPDTGALAVAGCRLFLSVSGPGLPPDDLFAVDVATGGVEWTSDVWDAKSLGAVDAERVYIAGTENSTRKVGALDLVTGGFDWQTDRDNGGVDVLADGEIYLNTPGHVDVLDAATGSLNRGFSAPVSDLRAAAGNTLYGTERTGEPDVVVALDRQSGTVLWESPANSVSAVTDGAVYASISSGLQKLTEGAGVSPAATRWNDLSFSRWDPPGDGWPLSGLGL